MPKSSKEKMEKDIQNIINELKKNSKNSVKEIADKFGFSRQKVCRIINDLEKDNTIWGYTTIIDDNKVGRKRFYLLLKKMSIPVPKEKIDFVIKRELKKSATKLGVEIENSCYVNGSFDWILCITADNITQVTKFCDSFYHVFGGNYLSKIQVLEVLFPIERNGFNNPNGKELKDFF
jgi:DNA-binding Lrp family transcriptional regulator